MKRLVRAALVLALGFAALFAFGPYEDSDLSVSFDPSVLADGVARYFDAQEARFDDITPGVEKQVIWAGASETKTDWAVLYLHGFSASSQEIRPVPEQVAERLGANLILTRLAGHGRTGAALAEARVQDWMQDTAEALAVAREIGDRVLVLSVSTGGTLAAAAAVDATLAKDVAGIVFISPNFGVNNPAAPLLTLPAARYWLPLLAGSERSFEPLNSGQATYWTTRYPSVAALPMAALVKAVTALDFSGATVPALFWYVEQDQVVRADVTAQVAGRWGGPATTVHPDLGANDDPFAHVIAGDILSPDQTEGTVAGILDWAQGL
ncbi:MAG: alpha/beta fold hydrolase [Pseudomonadota bacterium]